jgi:hypothetical protein
MKKIICCALILSVFSCNEHIKYIIFVLVALLCISCSENTRVTNSEAITFQWKVDNEQLIQDIIDTILFVPFEAHPEGMFKQADKVIIRGNKIFIYDMVGRNQVLVFDRDGKFLYKVGSRGAGPSEYVAMRNFTVDENYIYIIDNAIQKMLIYGISDGTYLTSKKLSFTAHDMEIAENGDFVFAQQRIQGETQPKKHAYHIIVTDIDLNIKTGIFPFQDDDCEIWSQCCYLKTTDKHIVFHTMVADSVVLFDRYIPTNDYSVYYMDFGNKKVPRKMQNNYDYLIKECRFLTTTPEITSRYIVGKYWHDDEICSDPYIYDVEKRTVYMNTYDEKRDKFFFNPVFHTGDTIFSLYDQNYYALWRNSAEEISNLPVPIIKHLDEGNDVLIKYVLK